MAYSSHQRKNQYENELAGMNKQELSIQQRFEQIINLLIMYKQANPSEEVILCDKHIDKMLKWYKTEFVDKIKGITK